MIIDAPSAERINAFGIKNRGFDVLALHHAEAILTHDMPDALRELEDILLNISIPIENLVRGGGGEAGSTQHMRRSFNERGWHKKNIVIRKLIDEVEVESLSHEIDHVKSFSGSTFALEIEWNNKDPFFDRNLENFKRSRQSMSPTLAGLTSRDSRLYSAAISGIWDEL